MKKLFIFLILVGLGVLGYYGIKKIKHDKYVEEVKKGWHVVITYDQPINVRSIPSTDGESLGKVKKGEVYKVLDINYEGKIYYWYKIEYKGEPGWIASGKKNHWVDDVGNPNDIADPVIKYYDSVYKVVSIDDINYKHLEVVEDSNKYEITHKVYHEVNPAENIDQYWIEYTIVDGAGKSSSKLQKIEFEERPDESRVTDFALFKRK